ncbi:MAG: ATP-binding cassette domain-containing protein [Lachnoclostridium sp.]|nr:ATP-binding cassette domain-containing protein [Lachnospira sp.]MCM1248671.1 ATP-binding cassette domain-containing protein [Lachnoclostridium sp.]
MLQIKHLTIRHKKDYRILLEDFNFSLNSGDKCALIGEEGNGKSTLLKLIYAPEMAEEYVEYEGEILRTGERFGYLPQEFPADKQECSVYEYFAGQEGFFDKEFGELARLCSKIGFSAERIYSDELLKSLSGGEKIKAQLIGLLIQEPTILLLDEPSNNLDMETLIWLEHFIKSSSIPVLYISHDETLLEHTANRIIHIEQLKRKTTPRCNVMSLGYGEYIAQRGMQFEKQEQMAKNERREYEKQQERFRRIQQKVEHQQNIVSRQNPHVGSLLKKSMHRIKAYEARFEKEFENMTECPEYEEAMFAKFGSKASMPEGKVVLDFNLKELCAAKFILAKNIHLFVRGPEHICIIGKNGCGKTTLMHRLAEGLLQRTDIKAAYMPQDYEEFLDLEQSAVDFLSDGSKESISMMRTYLGSMKFTSDEMMHPMKELSGGQKAKVMFLYLCASDCNVLLLDEPSRNFSPLSGPVIRRILADYQGAIISISHDRKYIAEVCDKVYELTEEGLKEAHI